MAKKIWITTNGRPSDSAALLGKQDGFGRAIFGKFVKKTDFMVNWGSGSQIELPTVPAIVWNRPDAVTCAIDKLRCFKYLDAADVTVPLWTADQKVAQGWSDEGFTVVVRTILSGHEGAGIIITGPGEKVPGAKLYTRYIFKEREFRVHVAFGKAIDVAKKIKDPEREVVSWKVRSWKNGFIFARNMVTPSLKRDQLAIDAVKALGLDFGAVDLIEDKHGKFYVLEVNTGPGIEGTTVTRYAEAFRDEAQRQA